MCFANLWQMYVYNPGGEGRKNKKQGTKIKKCKYFRTTSFKI